MLATLAAVLIGGGMTLVTQLVLDWARLRREAHGTDMQNRAVCRLFEDYFWVSSALIHEALVENVWWGDHNEPIWFAGQQEIANIVEFMDPTEVGLILAADRRFRGLMKRRHETSAPCDSEASVRWMTGALLLTEHCRLVLLARRGVTGRRSMNFGSIPIEISAVEELAAKLLPGGTPLANFSGGGIEVWH